jgi:hypothetical protein
VTSGLTVRELAAGDDLSGLAPLASEPCDPDRIDPVDTLVVVDHAEVIGIAGRRPLGDAVSLEHLHARPQRAVDVLAALAVAQGDVRIELQVRDPAMELDAAAGRAGYRRLYRQLRVHRSLADIRRPRPQRLTLRGYDEVGGRGLVAMLNAIWSGSPGPHGLPAERELDRFRALAERAGSGPPDTSRWRIAYFDGAPAGVALILCLDEQVGTLLYMGVVPWLRGRGLGALLHAEALWLMRWAGMRGYKDSTTLENRPMQRIFARAACEPAGSSSLWVRERTSDADEPQQVAPAIPSLRAAGRHVSLLRAASCRHR